MTIHTLTSETGFLDKNSKTFPFLMQMALKILSMIKQGTQLSEELAIFLLELAHMVYYSNLEAFMTYLQESPLKMLMIQLQYSMKQLLRITLSTHKQDFILLAISKLMV